MDLVVASVVAVVVVELLGWIANGETKSLHDKDLEPGEIVSVAQPLVIRCVRWPMTVAGLGLVVAGPVKMV